MKVKFGTFMDLMNEVLKTHEFTKDIPIHDRWEIIKAMEKKINDEWNRYCHGDNLYIKFEEEK